MLSTLLTNLQHPAVQLMAIALLALMAYAVLAGADFGGGIGDLLAFGPRADQHRQAIAKAMGPVWEANHVWLIFLIVILFSGFPPAFAAMSIAFYIPFHLVLLGIVLRGAAFVFRGVGALTGVAARAWAGFFGAASLITPFILGESLAALSSGAIRVSGQNVTVNVYQAWFSPFSLTLGVLTVALCAYLAAVYLTMESKGDVQEDFRLRALGSGGVTAVLAVLLLPLMRIDAPHLWDVLWQPHAAPLLLVGGILAVVSPWAIWWRHYTLARAAAVVEVILLLWGWGIAQWPYLIYPDVTIMDSASPRPMLNFLLAAIPVGMVLLVPSLWFLFRVFKGRNPAVEE